MDKIFYCWIREEFWPNDKDESLLSKSVEILSYS